VTRKLLASFAGLVLSLSLVTPAMADGPLVPGCLPLPSPGPDYWSEC
jgi:hypothetical protein